VKRFLILFFLSFLFPLFSEWREELRDGTPITIDWATDKDYPGIKPLYCTAFEKALVPFSSQRLGVPDKKKWIEGSIEGELLRWKEHLGTVWMKATLDGKLVAFLAFEAGSAPGTLAIRTLVVDLPYQRKGIGRALIKSFFKAHPGIDTVTTALPLTGAPFLEAMGFTPISKGYEIKLIE